MKSFPPLELSLETERMISQHKRRKAIQQAIIPGDEKQTAVEENNVYMILKMRGKGKKFIYCLYYQTVVLKRCVKTF